MISVYVCCAYGSDQFFSPRVKNKPPDEKRRMHLFLSMGQVANSIVVWLQRCYIVQENLQYTLLIDHEPKHVNSEGVVQFKNYAMQHADST
jgi:hypothetical protein